MHHDTGFAPNVEYNICTLSGCKNSKTGKRKNVEESAVKGSWVIGIGGNKTGNPNKLIYAMEVEKNLPYPQFRKEYPNKKYLKRKDAGKRVLVSTKFYYFGKNALNLPRGLKHIIINGRGCKCVTDNDVARLKMFIEKSGYRNYGVFGEPCNAGSPSKEKKC